jgi:hypothetical protein
MLGVIDWAKRLDRQQGVRAGHTVKTLQRITDRRNKIAHEGDRQGRSRASITVKEIKADLTSLERIVTAIEALLPRPTRPVSASS